ncbi:MAG: hypothetical protein J1E85_09405 [Ruminococcus sp.]|nr:hypothetical protein [Ruminococcus sp.]
MKRLIGLLLVVILSVIICGCSNRNQYSEEAIKAAENTIIYAEKYLNGEFNSDKAKNEIEKIEEKFAEYMKANEDADTYDNDGWIAGKISGIEVFVYTEDNQELEKQIKSLKEMIK